MQEQPLDQLPVLSIIQASYRDFFTQIKSHVILSYLISLPFFLINFMGWVRLPNLQTADMTDSFTFGLLFYMGGYLLAISLLVVFYFRLFTLGQENFLKISLPKLANIYGRTLIYSIMAAGLILIALLCLSLIGGLVISIIAGIFAMAQQQITLINFIIGIITLGLTFTIALRLQPTFISLAIGKTPLPFKTSWFFTAGHSWNIFLICAAALLLPYICGTIAQYFAIILTNVSALKGQVSNMSTARYVIFYLLSPISLASVALVSAASCNIRNHFFAEEKS